MFKVLVRSSQQRCCLKERVLKILQNSHRNTCVGVCNFIKQETPKQVFSFEFGEIFKNIFLQNTSGGCLFLVFVEIPRETSTASSQMLVSQKQPPEVFCNNRCSQKYRKIYRKTPVPESLLNKVAGLTPATLLKKRLWHMCFPANFAKFLRTPVLRNTSGRLLLVSC